MLVLVLLESALSVHMHHVHDIAKLSQRRTAEAEVRAASASTMRPPSPTMPRSEGMEAESNFSEEGVACSEQAKTDRCRMLALEGHWATELSPSKMAMLQSPGVWHARQAWQSQQV